MLLWTEDVSETRICLKNLVFLKYLKSYNNIFHYVRFYNCSNYLSQFAIQHGTTSQSFFIFKIKTKFLIEILIHLSSFSQKVTYTHLYVNQKSKIQFVDGEIVVGSEQLLHVYSRQLYRAWHNDITWPF